MSSKDKLNSELIAGTVAAIAALVDTLDQQGIMRKQDYRATLTRLWEQMPEEDAQGGEGFLFERLIDYLN